MLRMPASGVYSIKSSQPIVPIFTAHITLSLASRFIDLKMESNSKLFTQIKKRFAIMMMEKPMILAKASFSEFR